MDGCVFCGIASGKIKSNLVFEDSQIAVFPDINPAAPIHLLFVPKTHIEDFSHGSQDLINHLLEAVRNQINELGLTEKGYRIVVNGGPAKAVNHLHFHLLGDITKERQV